jgi:acyl-CoA reductase-like NAD-dependent aldehyde dehydrogenase
MAEKEDEMVETTNPATGEVLETYRYHDDDEITRRLAAAWSGYQAWAVTPMSERADLLRGLADRLDERRDDLARIATLEMGKPITQSRAEIEKSAWLARHNADHGSGYLEPERIETDAEASYVRYDPLGPILAVMPWNFPFWQVFRHAVPAAVAGNTILLKHASNVLGVAHAIEDVLVDAGFPAEFLQLLVIPHDVTEQIVADDRIRGVTLTGSDGVAAWQARLPGLLQQIDSPDQIFAGAMEPEEAEIASYAFVDYLLDRRNARRTRMLFDALQEGRDFSDSFASIYGASPDQVAERWLRGAAAGGPRRR